MDKLNAGASSGNEALFDPREVSSAEVMAAIDEPMPLQFLSQDIAAYMGKDFLATISKADLEAFCLRTIERDEPTGKLLSVLMQNFMKAYGNPETSEESMKAFDYLTYLVNNPGEGE